jgi:ATP-dependent helicase/nuclease subunit A
VHGAKGLEAPIVILPDMADRAIRDRDEIAALQTGEMVWKPSATGSPPNVAAARAARMAKSDEERLRLLYVALTRAQSWLIVAAAGKVTQDTAWYNLVRQGLDAAGTITLAGGVLRHEFGTWPAAALQTAPNTAPKPATLPLWATSMAPEAPRPSLPFAPSRLMGAKTSLDGAGDAEAMARGTAIHLLLEHLPDYPAAQWPQIANVLLGGEASAALEQAARVLSAPDLRHIFTNSLAEVAITAPTDKGQLLGVIDRLVMGDKTVLAVDFKSNQIIPSTAADVPQGILAQMGAYRAALAQIYPDHTITMAIIWTKTATLMPLDHEMVRIAFDSAALS